MRITINAPSYKRPGGVETLLYLPDCQVWVCETEEGEYRRRNPGAKIISVPKGVQGNLSRIRNWILDREADRGVEAICLVDDDLRYIGYWEGNRKHKLLTEDVMPWLIKYSVLAMEWGYRLWGVNCVSDKQAYREYHPFTTLSYIGGPFSVHIHSDIRYDERLPLKEDYDITLQHINKYRGALRLQKFWYQVRRAGSGTGQIGGCAAYRTRERERQQLELLQRKWGRHIVAIDTKDRNHKTKKRKGEDINPVISVPIRGV
ncbi:MAG: hypothetical protein AB1457_16235 [Chloroflexota bacterium]